MALPFEFEAFDAPEDKNSTVFLPANRLAGLKQSAHKDGRRLGYEEARIELEATQIENISRISASLQDLNFTYFEARKAVLQSLEPLLAKMVEVVLPAISDETRIDIVLEQVKKIALTVTDGPVELRCAPENLKPLEAALSSRPDMPVQARFFADIDCAGTEIRISSPAGETRIDLDLAITGIREEVTRFFALSMEEKTHG